MTYGEGVLSRMLTPGFAVMVVGILMVFMSRLLVSRVPEDKREKAGLAVKAAGTALVVLGTVLVFVS